MKDIRMYEESKDSDNATASARNQTKNFYCAERRDSVFPTNLSKKSSKRGNMRPPVPTIISQRGWGPPYLSHPGHP